MIGGSSHTMKNSAENRWSSSIDSSLSDLGSEATAAPASTPIAASGTR